MSNRVSNALGRALLAQAFGKKSKSFKGARMSREEFAIKFPRHAAAQIFKVEVQVHPDEVPKKKKKAPPTFTPQPREIRSGIFIPFNTPSSKNSKRIVKRGDKPMLINSELVMWYKRYTLGFWILHKLDFLRMIRGKEYPLRLQFHYIRDTKKDFDFNNASQIVQDLMVEHGWLPDDNMRFMAPQEPSYEVGDKQCCGVWINVL